MKKIFIIASIVSLFISCSDDLSENTQLPKVDSELSEYDKALDLIISFVKTAGTKSTKSLDLTGMKILSAKEDIYSFDLNDIIESQDVISERGSGILAKTSNSESIDVKVYTVKFENDGKEGYAIASSDERINDVFAFVPMGNLSDTSFNAGLKQALDNIKVHVYFI